MPTKQRHAAAAVVPSVTADLFSTTTPDVTIITAPAANDPSETVIAHAAAPIGTTLEHRESHPGATCTLGLNAPKAPSSVASDYEYHEEVVRKAAETRKAKALRVAKVVLDYAKLALLKVAKYAPAMILVTLGVIGAAMVLPKLATALLGLKLVTMTAGGLHTAGAFLLAHSPAFVITAANWVAAKAALILTLGGHVHYGVYAAKVIGFLSSMLNSFVNFVLIQGQVLMGLTAVTAKTGLAGTVAAGVLATGAELAVVGAAVDSVAKAACKKEPLAAAGNHVHYGVNCAASSTKRAVTSAWKGCKAGAVKVTTKVFGPCPSKSADHDLEATRADVHAPAAPAYA